MFTCIGGQSCVSDEALAAIGTIASLEQLWIGAGIHGRRIHERHVDHEKLRHHLRGLSRLKMLALACDSYVVVQNDDAGPLG